MSPDPEHDPSGGREDAAGAEERGEAGGQEPAAPLDRVGHGLLELLETLAVLLPVLSDPFAEPRKALRAGRENRVDHAGDPLLVRGEIGVLPTAQLEIRDVLMAQPGPHAPLGRHRGGLVAATPDQVEERCGELEGAHGRALAQEWGYESRRQLRGRLLLVLAVIAGNALTAEEPVRASDRGETREQGCREKDQDRAGEVVERVADPFLVVLATRGGGLLLRNDARQGVFVPDLCPPGRREHGAGEDDAELDELVRRDVHGSQLCLLR